MTTDVPTVAVKILREKRKIIDYFNPLKGKKEFAVFSILDPFPFIMEILRHFHIKKQSIFESSLGL